MAYITEASYVSILQTVIADRVSDELLRTDKRREADQYNHRVLSVETDYVYLQNNYTTTNL